MKRGKLNAAIDAAPTVYIRTNGLGLIALQKGSVKDAIARKFPNRSDETGMCLDADNAFMKDENEHHD